MGEPRSWEEMAAWMAELLQRRSGADVAEWNRRIEAAGLTDEPALRAYLGVHGVPGYAQILLVFERFGYPDYFTRSGTELIDGQYAHRQHLCPVYEALELLAISHEGTHVQARKGYVSFVGPRRRFAVVRAVKSRVDLGLRLGTPPGGRVERAGSALGNETITVRVGLRSVDDVDDEVAAVLSRAYDENL